MHKNQNRRYRHDTFASIVSGESSKNKKQPKTKEHVMPAKAQALPVDSALKQLIAARKTEIARRQEAKTANIKHIEAQNNRRGEILRKSLPKDFLTALEHISELSQEELKALSKNGKRASGATAKLQDAQPRVLPRPRNVSSAPFPLSPYYGEFFWAGGDVVWNSYYPGNVTLDVWSSGNANPTLVLQWWFYFQPVYPGTNAYYSFDLSASTYCQGSYCLDYGEGSFLGIGYNTGNADGWIDLYLAAYQDDYLINSGSISSGNIFNENPIGDFPAHTFQPLILPYDLSFQNYLQPTNADPIYVSLEQTFTIRTANNGYGEFNIWDGGDYISCPTLTVTPQP